MPRSIIVVASIIVAIGIFFFYTKPAYDGTQSIAAQNAQYDQALAKASQVQQIKQTLLAKFNSFDPTALNRLNTMLPEQVDNIRLILDLDNIASHYGMSIANVDITTPNSSSGSGGGGVTGAITAQAEPFDSLTIQFSTKGTYEQFKQFISDLDASLRIVDVENLTIAGVSAVPGADPSFSYSIRLKTYWLPLTTTSS